MSKCRPGLWLKPEDKNLFRYLHGSKVATVDQINRDVYRYDKIKSLYRRLTLLQNLKYVGCGYHAEFPKKKILSLTEKGFKEFISDGSERIVELKSQATAHDLTLVDIRFHLLKTNKIGYFYTENELKTWDTYWQSESFNRFIDIRCDGAIIAKLSRGEVVLAVEYEAARKSNERINGIIDKYYRTSGIPAVLYIFQRDEVFKTFQTLEAKYLREHKGVGNNKFFYTTLDKLENDDTLTFTDVSGNKLQLGAKSDSRMIVEYSTECICRNAC